MVKLLPTVMLSLLFLSGCSTASFAASPKPAMKAPAAQAADVKQLTVKEVPAYLKAHPKAIFIDVREADEYAEVHAPGTQLYPLSEIAKWAPTLDQHAEYVVICRSGARSGRACANLSGQGFTHVVNVQGGMLQWEAEGLPVKRPAQ